MQHALSHNFFTWIVHKCPKSLGNFGGVPDDSLDSLGEPHALDGASATLCLHFRFAALVAFGAGARRFFRQSMGFLAMVYCVYCLAGGPGLARTSAGEERTCVAS